MSLPIQINRLSEQAIAYEGRAELVEEEVARWKARAASREKEKDEESGPRQPRLL